MCWDILEKNTCRGASCVLHTVGCRSRQEDEVEVGGVCDTNAQINACGIAVGKRIAWKTDIDGRIILKFILKELRWGGDWAGCEPSRAP